VATIEGPRNLGHAVPRDRGAKVLFEACCELMMMLRTFLGCDRFDCGPEELLITFRPCLYQAN